MKRNIIEVKEEYTGGGCVTYYGKFNTGEYFACDLDVFAIYDADYSITFTQEFFEQTEGDTSEWEQQHLVAIYNGTEVPEYIDQIKSFLKETK